MCSEVSTYRKICTICVEIKQFQKALEYFTEAIALDENYYSRSNVLHELGANEAAISDFETCPGFNPGGSVRQLILRRLDIFRHKKYLSRIKEDCNCFCISIELRV